MMDEHPGRDTNFEESYCVTVKGTNRELLHRSRLHRPRNGTPSITRPRLITRLNDSNRSLLTVVRAPAGYGKSTLLRDWDAAHQTPSAWLQVEEGDNDVVQFVTSIVAAIDVVLPGFGDQTLSLLSLYDVPGPRLLGATLADELLALPADLTLIVDDFHLIASPSVHELMAELLRFPLPGFHLILGSRSEPPIGLPRLRAHGFLQEITPDEMRFTTNEVEALLAMVAPQAVSPEQIDVLATASEGWAAVLHLATIHLKHRGDTDPAWMQQGSAAETLRYLALQEIDRLLPQDRRFLIRIGQLERINADLAELLSFDLHLMRSGSEQLGEVRARGLFLFPIPAEGGWFTFHQVFRSVLLDLASELQPTEIPEIHLRAAHWFNEHGLVEPAIGHALALEQPDLAASFVLQHAQLALVQDRRLAVLRWLGRLPERVLESNVDLLLIRACIYQPVGRYDLLVESVRRAQELLATTAPGPERDRQRAEMLYLLPMVVATPYLDEQASFPSQRAIGVLLDTDRAAESFAILNHAMLLHGRDPASAKAFIKQVVFDNADRDGPFAAMRTIWARTAETLIAGQEGDLQRSGDLAHAMISLASSAGMERLIGHGDFLAGAYHLQVDELDEAEAHLERAIRNPHLGIIFRTNVAMSLARCRMARGAFDSATGILNEEMDRLLEGEALQLLPMLRTSRARLAICRGRYDEAVALLNLLPADYTDTPSRSSDSAFVMRANAAIGMGAPTDLERAERYLVQSDEVLTREWHFGLDLSIRLTRGLLAFVRGDVGTALPLAQEALRDAELRGYRRVGLDLGPQMDTFLLWVSRNSAPGTFPSAIITQIQRTRSARILPAAPFPPTRQAQLQLTDVLLIEDLTNRELDVLLLLQRRLANKEIADELSISPLTVKSHTRRLYRKLDVSNRRQAIARATELHIIPSG